MHTEPKPSSSTRSFVARRRAGLQPTPQTVHVPTPMLRDMQKYAQRLNRTVSWCTHMAWNMASAEIQHLCSSDPARQSRLLSGRKHPRTVALPAGTWEHIHDEAARLDRSRSWLLQQAWLIARHQFVKAAR